MHSPPAAPPSASRRMLALAAMAPALFVAALYWPVRDGGLLADDLLLASYVVEPTPAGFEPAWGRVAADFAGPWAFVHGGYYRPLTTLSLVLDQWLGGGAEQVGHGTCIALAAASVFAVAWLCGALFGALAALAGGLLFATHPALHEPVCWPATRADLLAAVAMPLACIPMVRHLRGEPGRHLLLAHAGFVAALLCKEVGLWTLAWFVLLDVGIRGRAVGLAARARLYAPFAAVVGAYWLLRLAVLEDPLAEAAQSPFAEPWRWLGLAWGKVVASVAPHGDWLPPTLPWTLGAALLGATVLALARRDVRRWVPLGVAWWLGSLLPAQWHYVSPNMEKARYLIAGITGLCVVVAAAIAARAAGGSRWLRWGRAVAGVLLLVAVGDLARASRALQRHYQDAWAQMAVLRREVDAAGRRATVDAPLAMLTGLPLHHGIVFLEPQGAFALAQPPLASAEHPFVSLGMSLQQGIGAGMLEGELATWRQLWRHGATLCYWFDADGDPRLVTIPPRANVPAPRFVAAGAGSFRAEGLASPWPIGGLEVVADGPFERGDLVWHTPAGNAGLAVLGAGVARDGTFTAVADLHEDGSMLVFGSLHGIERVDVALHGGRSPHATALRVVPPDEPVPLRSPLGGARAAIAELGAKLPWHELPADAEPGTASAVLMTKAFACRVPHPGSGPVVLPQRALRELIELERFSRFDRVWYYLECRVAGRRWRSTVDWFERVQGT
jgi:hypothetical protein